MDYQIFIKDFLTNFYSQFGLTEQMAKECVLLHSIQKYLKFVKHKIRIMYVLYGCTINKWCIIKLIIYFFNFHFIINVLLTNFNWRFDDSE